MFVQYHSNSKGGVKSLESNKLSKMVWPWCIHVDKKYMVLCYLCAWIPE